MQIQTTVRYHYMLIRMAKIKKKNSKNAKRWQGCREPGALTQC